MNWLFDLHCDTPYNIAAGKFNHIKPALLHKQGYLGAVFAHFIYPKAKYPFVEAMKMIGLTKAYLGSISTMMIVEKYPALNRKRTNILLGVEGGHIFDSVFTQVEALHALGVRVFTLTWNNSNKLASSGLEADKRGLTRLGRQYVKRMGKLDVILDMSHASTRTVLDVCEIIEKGIIASHSCIRKLNPSFLRNIDDRAIRAIHERGGVVGVNFSRHHLGKHSVFDHVDYLCQKFGTSCAAIGSDFDGITDPVFAGPRDTARLENQLLRKGYTSKDIGRIFSGNFLGVLKKA